MQTESNALYLRLSGRFLLALDGAPSQFSPGLGANWDRDRAHLASLERDYHARRLYL